MKNIYMFKSAFEIMSMLISHMLVWTFIVAMEVFGRYGKSFINIVKDSLWFLWLLKEYNKFVMGKTMVAMKDRGCKGQ